MSRSFLVGNEAIGLGAVWAGTRVISGYPGTLSMEVLETAAKHNPRDIYVEWSVNEKAGAEVAATVIHIGARTMVTMKQVGLNVTSDPLVNLAYTEVRGDMVVVVADDPEPISSRTEQDTRRLGQFFKLPALDPSSPEEVYEMIKDAFECSEKYHTPVLFRPTTRLYHECVNVKLKERVKLPAPEGLVKDPDRWIIFPRLSHANHRMTEACSPIIGEDFSSYKFNPLYREEGSTVKDIITHGISYGFVMEALNGHRRVRVLKVSISNPVPECLLLEFAEGLDQVMAVEELDPVLEQELLPLSGRHHLSLEVKSKLTGEVQTAGKNPVESVRRVLEVYLGEAYIRYLEGLEGGAAEPEAALSVPSLSVRLPILCAGYPHQASFYTVKRAVEKLNEDLGEGMASVEGVYCGDIGCYTLGNAKLLNMVDTYLCMDAGITMTQGLQRVKPDKRHFSFVGDSIFSASSLTGIVNTVYDEASLILYILDNSTTAMIGHQPYPGTDRTMMGNVVEGMGIIKVLGGVGVKNIITADALDLSACVDVVLKPSAMKGVKVITFRSPCVAIIKSFRACRIAEDRCMNCRTCINKIGCPALMLDGDMAGIDSGLCTECGLCGQICSVDAIETVKQSRFRRMGQGRCLESEVHKATKNVLLCRAGSQGTALASRPIVLTAMEKGMEVRGAETIGVVQRGGSVVNHVRISREIYSPLILHGGVNMIISFEPAEAVRCLPYLKKGGYAVVSPAPIRPVIASLAGGAYMSREMVGYLEYARENLVMVDAASIGIGCGSPKMMDTILLGAAVASGLIGISLEEMEAAIEKRVPEKSKDMNIKALKLGAVASAVIR